MAAGAVRSHDIVILSFCNIVKGQANYFIVVSFCLDSRQIKPFVGDNFFTENLDNLSLAAKNRTIQIVLAVDRFLMHTGSFPNFFAVGAFVIGLKKDIF